MSETTGIFRKLSSKLDHTPNDIPMGKRLGAYFIDWSLGGIISGFPAVLLYGVITGKSDMFSDLYVFEALGFERYWGMIAGILCLLAAILYYIVVPCKIWRGQTLGKHLLGLRIVRKDGKAVRVKELILRQGIAIFLMEGTLFIISTYIRQLVTLVTWVYVDAIWQYIGIAFTLLSVVLAIYTASHRALHDYIGGTKVVLALKEEEVKRIRQDKQRNLNQSSKKENRSQCLHLRKRRRRNVCQKERKEISFTLIRTFH